jgi:hypothetical protein
MIEIIAGRMVALAFERIRAIPQIANAIFCLAIQSSNR